MRRISPVPVRLFLSIALISALAATCFAQAGPRNRILQPIDDRQTVALHGNVLPMARAEFERGRMNPAQKLEGISLGFKLSDAQQADLDRLLAEQQDPASANYRKWLTPEQYAARFGMSEADLDRVTTWLQSQGFTDIRVSRSHTRISFNGTVAQVESALKTEMHNYDVNGKAQFANATDPSLPAAFADAVLGFRHLDSVRPKPHSTKVAVPRFTSSQSGNHFLSPGDFATIYNIGPLYAAGIDGTGITIAVIGQTAINLADISAFRANSGLPANPPVIRQVAGTGTSMTCSGDIDEASLDVEWSGAVAKNATILYNYAGVGPSPNTCTTLSRPNAFDALFDAIDNNLAAVISISYGNCEANIGIGNANILRQAVQQANAQGQTLSASSGDAGAADCDTAASATHGLAVDLPAAIPETTALGGTEFMGDNTTGGNTFWAAAPNSTTDNISSALSYIPEMAWNDSPTTGNGTTLSSTLSATGGGTSAFFTKAQAPWQTALTPADGRRDVPDVSLPASPNHDGYLVCSQGNCVNGFRKGDGSLTVFGGTSVSSQVFAGVLALINQATKSTIGLGNANPTLYSLAASTPAAFHDVTTGSNIVPCTQSSTGCPASAPFKIGFNTSAGYDLVTGLGSMDVNALTRAWPGFNLTPTSTTTTVTSSALNASAGANVTFTATVASSASGGPDITGTVQFMVDGSASGGPAAVAFSGAASAFVATLSTTALATGTHSVTAVYSGASPNYTGSTSAAISEVISGGFSMSSTAATVATPGASGTSTITVTPGAGFNGTVALTCAPPVSSSEISCTLNPTSVTVNGSAQTSTLTITTTAAHGLGRTSAGLRSTPGKSLWWMGAGSGSLFAGILVAGVPSRRRRWLSALGLMLCVLVAVGAGCGGGSTSATGSGTKDPGTTAGTYSVTVTGTSGGLSSQTTVSVTVQ